MTCKDTEQYLLENHGRMLPEDVKEHVASCQKCREFERVLALTASSAGDAWAAPSKALDAAVMMACTAEICRQRRMHWVWKSLRIAAVACVVVLLAWQMMPLNRSEKPLGGHEVTMLQTEEAPDAIDDMLISLIVTDKMFSDWEADADLAWMKSVTPAPETANTVTEATETAIDSPLGDLNSAMLDVELILMDNLR